MPPAVPQDRKRKASKASAAQPQDRYAPTSWGTAGGLLEDLTVPSGQVCLARRPGVQGLIEAGVLRDIDSLTAIVDSKHIKRVHGNPEPEIDTESLMGDTEALLNILAVVDKVLCYVVVKPEIVLPPEDVTSREDGVIYADMIEIEDKMFVFNFAVGGTRSLETFREQRDASLGSVEAVEDDGGATE